MTSAEGSWNETVAGIKNIIPTQIYATTNTTLSKYNASNFLETIDFLKKLGVAAFGCNSLIYSGKANAISEEFALPLETLRELLPKVHDKANQLGLKFLWYTPTQYCRFDPVQLGLGVKSCTAAMINMCVGPNGDVYPCQSYFETACRANPKERICRAKMHQLPATSNLWGRMPARTAEKQLHLWRNSVGLSMHATVSLGLDQSQTVHCALDSRERFCKEQKYGTRILFTITPLTSYGLQNSTRGHKQ
jgi:MoaA/NifB/PqqE/SkfB family radical SAM enzyme